MEQTLHLIGRIFLIVLGLAFLAWILFQWLRTSQDSPARLILKWIITAAVILFAIVPLGRTLMTTGQAGAFNLVFIAAAGVVLAILWTGNIVGWFGRGVESIFTGGNDPPEPEPFYSMAIAYRKRGDYNRALEEVEKQLNRFPNDPTGHLLQAEIQAVDLKDLTAAQAVIDEFCELEDVQPQHLWSALNTMADWHVTLGPNIEAAQGCLTRIMELAPDTPEAALARQRMGHLGTKESHAARLDRTPIQVRPGVKNLGLLDNTEHLKSPEETPDEALARLSEKLEAFPQNAEAREELAQLYAGPYQDLDEAISQLEQLIQLPHQPFRQVVRCLNLLADFQVKQQANAESVKATLQRIVDLNPQSGLAEQARSRMSRISLELKGQTRGKSLKWDH